METPEFRLVPDTNVLRTRDEKMAFFSSDFLAALKPRLGATKRAFVCEITAKEITYQKTAIAQANLDKLIGASKSLYALSGQEFEVRDIGELRVHVQKQLETEMRKLGFEILRTPIDQIDWGEMVEDAVWRKPPFEGNPDSKTEKGFRDAVFVQTVIAAVKKDPAASWCILTNDALAYQRLGTEAKVTFPSLSLFRTTEEFLGHVELRVQKFEEALAANLQAKAHVAFYNPGTKTGIFVTGEVEKRIREKHNAALESVPTISLPDGIKAGFSQLVMPFEIWVRSSGDQIFLEGTRFEKRETKTRIRWITRIRMCAVFLKGSLPNQPVYPPSVIRDTRFDVHWSAEVVGDTFSSATVGPIALVSNERASDSAFARMQLGLPIPETSVFANTATPNLSTNVAVPSGVAFPELR